jgi:hypothetical protein
MGNSRYTSVSLLNLAPQIHKEKGWGEFQKIYDLPVKIENRKAAYEKAIPSETRSEGLENLIRVANAVADPEVLFNRSVFMTSPSLEEIRSEGDFTREAIPYEEIAKRLANSVLSFLTSEKRAEELVGLIRLNNRLPEQHTGYRACKAR